jgi:hypothetical protein
MWDSFWFKWHWGRFLLRLFRFSPANYHSTFAVYLSIISPPPESCEIALTRQYIITYSVFEFEASSVARHLAAYWVTQLNSSELHWWTVERQGFGREVLAASLCLPRETKENWGNFCQNSESPRHESGNFLRLPSWSPGSYFNPD